MSEKSETLAKMRARGGVLLVMVVIAGCACEPSFSGSPNNVQSLVTQRIAPLLKTRKLVGAAVAVIRGDAVQSFYFGELEACDGVPPDARTEFEIGSVTKTYTAALLALMIADGSLDLETPVQSLLPAGVRSPTFDGRGMTLGDLASHVSGLPRMPSNFHPRSAADPFSDYMAEDLYAFLNTYVLPRAPGSAYEYSNLGMALLGHLLARKAGTPYARLLQDRLLTPLGLNDTTLTLSINQTARLARPYARGALHDYFCLPPFPTYPWDTALFAPAAGLHTTVDDLVRYARANLHPEGTALAPAAALLYTPRAHADGETEVALAWHVRRAGLQPEVVWHNGETGGYCSFVALNRAQGEAVVILANTDASAYTKAAALAILDGMAGLN